MSANVVSVLRGRRKASEATVRLVEELHTLAADVLRVRLNAMFDGADDLLFEFAERATNNNDRRLFFDTMRAVRLGRTEMTQQFFETFAAGFGAPPPAQPKPAATRGYSLEPHEDDDGLEFTLQNSESVELQIAISNMATKAEGLYKQAIWEVGGRVKALIEDSHAPMTPDALTPNAICSAFRVSAEMLDVEFAVELVIFKLFDRLVISDLADLYARVLQFLKHHGVRAHHAGDATTGRASVAPSSYVEDAAGPLSAGAARGPGESYRPVFANASLFTDAPPPFSAPPSAPVGLAAAMMMSPSLDAATLSTLQRISASAPSAAVYSNASLAADLAAAAQGQVIVGWGPRQTTAYVQRASLVGHMFNDILADPHLPADLRALFDGLRLSTIKVALRDFAFVSDIDHPVRSLINELATMATTARTGGSDSMERIGDLVREIQKQFDIASETLRKPASDIELIDTEQAERFIEQQLAQTAARRQAMVKRVRRIIAEELALRTRGHNISEDMRPLLNSGWAPMMAMHLLHHGPDSKPWREGMTLLDRILNTLDPNRPETRGEAVLKMLVDDIEKELLDVGLAEGRVRAALDGYAKAVSSVAAAATLPAEPSGVEPPVAAVSVPSPAPGGDGVSELLELLITPGTWFLIHDHERGESRWMKAVAFYAGLDCAAFAEFNGSNTLLMKSRVLLDDLLARRTVPIDLGPSATHALDLFLARAA